MLLENSGHVAVALLRHLYILLEGQIGFIRLVTSAFNLVEQVTMVYTRDTHVLAVEVPRLPHQVLKSSALVPMLHCRAGRPLQNRS